MDALNFMQRRMLNGGPMAAGGQWTRGELGQSGMTVIKPAEEILPKEIWDVILQKLHDPLDLYHCSKSCKLFAKLLEKREWEWTLGLTLPHLVRHLTGESLLKCRQIRRSCCKAVDRFIEGHPSIRPHSEGIIDLRQMDFVYPLKEKQIGRVYCFKFNQDGAVPSPLPLEFVDNFNFPSAEGVNPFIGRNIKIILGRRWGCMEPDSPRDQWWDELFDFLDAFGKYVFYLDLVLPFMPTPELQEMLNWFVTFRLMESLPNLRKLNLVYRGEDYQQQQPTLAKTPITSTLETLEFNNVKSRDPVILLKLIEIYRRQLRKLHFTGANLILVCATGLTFNSLQELIVDLGGSGNGRNESIRNEMFNLAELALGMPTLLKLKLNFPVDLYYRYLWEHLLQAINLIKSRTHLRSIQLGGTLSGLKFASAKESLNNDFSHRIFRHSCVTTVEIDLDWKAYSNNFHPPNYDFLVWCFPQLEQLVVFTRLGRHVNGEEGDFENELDLMGMKECIEESINWDNRQEVIDLHEYLYINEAYESNIWVMLPFLNFISYQYNCYTRKGYEKYQARKARIGS